MFYKINTEYEKYSTLDSAKQLLEDLRAHQHEITKLDLSLNTFVPEVFAEIAALIKDMKALKHIRLESILDSLTFGEMCLLLESLGGALPRDLRVFELPSNAVSCEFPDAFGVFLQQCPLEVLNLSNCGLGEDGLKRIVGYLDGLENKDNLVSLNLSRNRINVICEEFVALVNKFTNLTELVLNANTIEEKSMAYFLRNIESERLRVLDLADNFVCGAAIDHLCDLFHRNDISELYLQDIKIDDGDIGRLLRAMGRKRGYPGALAAEKPKLTLDLSYNSVDQECIGLLEALTETYAFVRLAIFENDYESAENLKKLVGIDSGCVVEEEEDEMEAIDGELLEKLKGL